MKANYSSFIQRIQVHLSVHLINTKYATYHSYRHFGALNQVFFGTQDKTTRNFRNSRPKVFLGKGVLKTCSKFTGEHPCWSVISIKVARQLATLKSFRAFQKETWNARVCLIFAKIIRFWGPSIKIRKSQKNFRRKHGNRILQNNLNVIPNRLIPTTDFSHIVQIIWRYQFRIIVWRWNF